MKEKETKNNLEELKDRKIEEEALEDVAGGTLPGETDFFGIKDATTHPNSKKYKGGLSGALKK